MPEVDEAREAEDLQEEAAGEAVIPTESREAEWAVEDDLPRDPYKDIVLPHMGKKVRVHFLSNIEAAHMGMIPDLMRFGELMAENALNINQPETPDEGKERLLELLSERLKYKEAIAHFCVRDPRGGEGLDCCDLAPHPKSLWSAEQVAILDDSDLEIILATAERADIAEAVRPFSQDLTAPDSESSATTGESTQPTS